MIVLSSSATDPGMNCCVYSQRGLNYLSWNYFELNMVITVEHQQANAQHRDKNDCVICGTIVESSALAVQCDECDLWTHCSCGSISNTLYKCIMSSKTKMIKIKCMKCLAADSPSMASLEARECRIQNSLSDKIDVGPIDCAKTSLPSDSSDHGVNCVAAPPDAVSTLMHSSDEEEFEDAPTMPLSCTPSGSKPCRQSYAEVASTSPRKSAVAVKKGTRRTRRTTSSAVPVKELAARVKQLEEFISNRVLADPKTGNGCLQSKKKMTQYSASQATKVLPPKNIDAESERKTNPKESRQKPVNRERCIIVLNAPESVEVLPERRMNDDRIFLGNCISRLFDESETGVRIVSAYRLGKKEMTCRPTRVHLRWS